MKTSAIPLTTIALALAGLLFSATASAGADCKPAPRHEWLSEAAMKDQILKAGYKIDKFKISGDCYEIYGKDTDGRKVEIYFDPTDGHIVKERRN